MVDIILRKKKDYPQPVSVTYGVASLQLATTRISELGVGSVVFLHHGTGGCLDNR